MCVKDIKKCSGEEPEHFIIKTVKQSVISVDLQ
ncbi:MAG: hypothetical protein RL222_1996, partial [Bacteroidota bacterium]